MPLLLVGIGITIAFRAGVINIGGEGQIIAGALVATMTALALPGVPRIVLVPLAIVVGAIGGAIWGGLAGALKSYAGVNEILSTIMLNIIAVQIMNLLLRGPLMDPGEIERGSRIPQTERLTDNADLPILPGGTRLHLGVVIAVLMAVACYFLLFRTTQGLRLRAVGHNPFASRYAGMSVKRNVVLAFMYSGAMCGIAGVTLVFGSEGHRLATDGGATTFTGAAGFNGIVAALFGGLHPLWTIPASFLFGSLLVGAKCHATSGASSGRSDPGPQWSGGGVRGREHAGTGAVGDGRFPASGGRDGAARGVVGTGIRSGWRRSPMIEFFAVSVSPGDGGVGDSSGHTLPAGRAGRNAGTAQRRPQPGGRRGDAARRVRRLLRDAENRQRAARYRGRPCRRRGSGHHLRGGHAGPASQPGHQWHRHLHLRSRAQRPAVPEAGRDADPHRWVG